MGRKNNPPDHCIKEDDVLMVMGENADVEKLVQQL